MEVGWRVKGGQREWVMRERFGERIRRAWGWRNNHRMG